MYVIEVYCGVFPIEEAYIDIDKETQQNSDMLQSTCGNCIGERGRGVIGIEIRVAKMMLKHMKIHFKILYLGNNYFQE